MTSLVHARPADLTGSRGPAAGPSGDPAVEVYGIRHHGPGSARSLLAALEAFDPDIVLIEGPADADPVLHWAGAAGTKPPVALLAYAADGADAVLVGEGVVTGGNPRQAVADLVAAGAHPSARSSAPEQRP